MGKLKYNKSKTYLLPLLSELIDIDSKFFHCLRNTYIKDDLNMYEDCIYILHDFSFKNPEFTKYENQLVKNQYFVDLIDISNTQVLYIFRFKEEYLHEYNKFQQGKYSEFGLDAKELILEFYTSIYKNNINAVSFLLKVKQILFKDKKLKQKLERELSTEQHKVSIDDDAELTDPINEEDETIDISKYIKNVSIMKDKEENGKIN